MQVKRFRTVLEPLPGNLGWVVARLPFDPAAVWKKMIRLRVKVEVGGHSFRTSLFTDSKHQGHFVLVNKQMQRAAGIGCGGMIDLAIEPDLEERASTAPKKLEELFEKEKALAEWYSNLSDSMKRDIARTIREVKSPEARQKRVEQMAERMLSVMEGEQTLPPILDVAFRRVTQARRGWELMTPVQRRGHLLGVFYYQSPEARERRTDKVVRECLRVAAAKKGTVIRGG